MKTFVYIDHFKGEVQPASWEALGLAKSLGTAIALVFGSGEAVANVAKTALEYAPMKSCWRMILPSRIIAARRMRRL